MGNFSPGLRSYLHRRNNQAKTRRELFKKQWICVKHPLSLWLPGFIQCSEGYKKGENCEKRSDIMKNG